MDCVRVAGASETDRLSAPNGGCSTLPEARKATLLLPLSVAKSGAGERDRTADLPFTRRPLCQLSYTGGDFEHGSRTGP
jgi:hypothetical protein